MSEVPSVSFFDAGYFFLVFGTLIILRNRIQVLLLILSIFKRIN